MSTTRSDITDDGNYSDDDGGGVIDQEEKYIVLRLRFHYQVREIRNCFGIVLFFKITIILVIVKLKVVKTYHNFYNVKLKLVKF